MTYSTQIGERVYEFENMVGINTAREIYVHCVGDQNEFETELEEAGVEFIIEQDCFIPDYPVPQLEFA